MSEVDPKAQRPIPVKWRPVLRQIVNAFAQGNYNLEPGIVGVEPVPPSTASQVRDYVQGYGATLTPLPDETWNSSVCTFNGHEWEVLVDLWTQEEGRSDLVMHVQIGTSGLVRIHAVYVP